MKKNMFIVLLAYLITNLNTANIQAKSCATLTEPCQKQCGSAKRKSANHTYFMPRSVIENVSLYFGLNNYYQHRKYFEPCDLAAEQEPRIHMTRSMFYEKSHTNNKKKNNVARYFLPNNQCSASIREDGTGDIGSLWFRVIAPNDDVYSSTLTLNPERTAIGSYINYHQDFECLKGLWLDVQFAVYQVKHYLHAREVLTNPDVLGTLPGASTVLEDTLSGDLRYGKIKNCLEDDGFDDCQVKLGYDFYHCPEDGYYLGLYASTLIPLASKPTAEFMFEPRIGRGHWGFGVGLDAGCLAYQSENRSLAFMADFSYQYLIKGTEKRSFDLKNNGPWSRYLRVATEAEPAVSTSAINYTTMPVKVEPRGVVNLWLGAHYQHCKWHFEAGYNLWWRQSEKICLKPNKCRNGVAALPQGNLGVGIFGMGNVCNPTSASTANISQGKTFTGTGNVVVNDATFTPLTLADLDLASASHPATLTNKVYAAIAYDWCIFCRPVSIGLNASYEFSRDKNAFSNWGIAGNLETSF